MQYVNLVKENIFQGVENEDPHKHQEKFLNLV